MLGKYPPTLAIGKGAFLVLNISLLSLYEHRLTYGKFVPVVGVAEQTIVALRSQSSLQIVLLASCVKSQSDGY